MNNNELLNLALQAAELGGCELKKYQDNVDPDSIETKRMGDWVSEADRASENRILEFLQTSVPDHDILTEETGYKRGNTKAEFRWIIDPLDGTTNFLRHFPVWAVSIAIERRVNPGAKWGEVVVGVINIPLRNEVFHAIKDQGSFRNGIRLKLKDNRAFNESLLATGFPFRTRHLVDQYMKLFAELMKNCADVRRAGAVAVDLCYVAAGIFDGFWELDLAPWDIAAGGLIISEAGGLVSNFQGGDDYLTTGDIVAGNISAYNELIHYVRKHFPDPRDVDKSPRLN